MTRTVHNHRYMTAYGTAGLAIRARVPQKCRCGIEYRHNRAETVGMRRSATSHRHGTVTTHARAAQGASCSAARPRGAPESAATLRRSSSAHRGDGGVLGARGVAELLRRPQSRREFDPRRRPAPARHLSRHLELRVRRALSPSCSNGVAAPGDHEARAPRSFVALVETQLLEWNPASAGARHALLPAAPLKAVRPLGELGRRARCSTT